MVHEEGDAMVCGFLVVFQSELNVGQDILIDIFCMGFRLAGMK